MLLIGSCENENESLTKSGSEHEGPSQEFHPQIPCYRFDRCEFRFCRYQEWVMSFQLVRSPQQMSQMSWAQSSQMVEVAVVRAGMRVCE